MKKNNLYYIIFSVLLLGIATNGNATTVGYKVSNVGGNSWEYTYSVTNDSLDIRIHNLGVSFDSERFENLEATSTPAGWRSSAFELTPRFSNVGGGYFADIRFGSGIVPGETLGGFSVQFDYLGAGIPGSQLFEIFDNLSVSTLDEGTTITSPVPLPPALWLFVSGITMLVSQSKVFPKETLLA